MVGVTQTDNQVVVNTIDGSKYRTIYLMRLLTPSMQRNINSNPPLRPLRNQLNQRCPMGSVIKAIVYYKTTFWRGKGYCGSLLIEGEDDCPLPFTLDDTKPDGTEPAIIGYE